MKKEQANDPYDKLFEHIGQRIHLNELDKVHIRSFFSVRKLLSRQYLVSQGDVCQHESYVCEGFLRSFHVDDQGNEITLHFAREDWWISDLQSFLKQKPASRNVVATQPTKVLQIQLKDREILLEKVPKLERFWRILNEHASMAQDQRIMNNISLSGAERYIALLKKYPDIEQQLSQKHIASYLGITPVFLSQIRKEIARN